MGSRSILYLIQEKWSSQNEVFMTKVSVPTYDALMNPRIQALKSLGGSATIEELTDKVAEFAGLTDEQLEVLHNPAEGGRTEIEYRLAWSRTWLERYGLLEISTRGIWSLTAKGSQIDKVDEREVVRSVREQIKQAHENKSVDEVEDEALVDRAIDGLVYELYGLTEEEVKIIEGEK